MIFNSIIIILTASALPSIHVSPHQLTRCGSLVLLSTGVVAANTLNVSAMGPGISLYEGIIQVTPMSQATDAFICLVAFVIVGLVWTPEKYIKTVKTTIDSVKTYQPAVAEYSVIVLFTTLGALILVSSTSLVTVYLGVELQSFAVYILASLY